METHLRADLLARQSELYYSAAEETHPRDALLVKQFELHAA